MSDILGQYASVVKSVLDIRGAQCLQKFDGEKKDEKVVSLHTKTTRVAIDLISRLNTHLKTILNFYVCAVLVMPLTNLLPIHRNRVTYMVMFIVACVLYFIRPILANVVLYIRKLEQALQEMDALKAKMEGAERVHELLSYFIQNLKVLLDEADASYQEQHESPCALDDFQKIQIFMAVISPSDAEK